MTESKSKLDVALEEARKARWIAHEAGDAMQMLEVETTIAILDKKQDFIRYAGRLARRLVELAERVEAEPRYHFALNSLGEVQGSGLDIDRICIEIADLRKTLENIGSARKAAEKKAQP